MVRSGLTEHSRANLEYQRTGVAQDIAYNDRRHYPARITYPWTNPTPLYPGFDLEGISRSGVHREDLG